MNRRGSVLQPSKDAHPLDQLEEVVVKVTTFAALGFLGLLVLLGAVTGESHYFLEAVNPAVPALTGVWMMRTQNPRVLGQLIPSAITIALLTGLADVGSRSGALLGILSMGIAGALMARRFAVHFIVGASFGLFGLAYWWNVGGWESRERISESMIPAFAFAFAAGLVTWLGRTLFAEGRRRQWATESLVASEEQFRTAFESSAALMALVSLDEGRFLKVNEAACRLLGFDRDRLTNMTLAEIVHPEDAADHRERMREILTGQSTHCVGSMRYVRGDGDVAYGVLSMAVASDAAGLHRHIVLQLVDTTDQHRAEQRLVDLLASRDELIASVSHELRTPMTAVLGYASLLLESGRESPPPDYESMLEEIHTHGRDLVGIIEDLLTFAQSQGDSIVVKPEEIDLRDQVTLVLESLRAESPVDHIEVRGERLAAYADSLRVRQVIRNLLTNAVRHGGEEIVVEMARQDGAAHLVVRDSGKGVAADDRERIFEPYQRSNTRDGLTASIGVGLTVARRLARAMSGDLEYSYENDQSQFILTLPLDQESTTSQQPDPVLA